MQDWKPVDPIDTAPAEELQFEKLLDDRFRSKVWTIVVCGLVFCGIAGGAVLGWAVL